MKDIRINFEDNRIQKFIGELLQLAREALVELNASHVCVASYQFLCRKIEVTSPRSLSPNDLQRIKSAITKQLHGKLQPRKLSCVINGLNEEKYEMDTSGGKLHKNLTVPVSIEKVLIGILFVGSFETDVELLDARLVEQFSKYISGALRHLWSLNSRKKEQFELLASRVIDGLILCDSKKKIKFINNSAKRVLGVSDEKEWIGRPLNELETSYLIDNLDEALEAGIFELNKVENSAHNRKKLIGIHIELLRNARNHEIGWMIILRDVTRNWQSDQMRTVLSVASHEIKTPLHSILGAVDLLLEHDLGKLNKQQRQCLKIIRDDIHRLNRLLTDILELSKFDEGVQFVDRRNQVVLGLMVKKVIESFTSFARSKNIRIVCDIPKTIPAFKANRDRLQQVIVNLVENGINYSLPGGKVEIIAELLSSSLKVSVRDKGVGIPTKDLDIIFERFKRLDNHPEEGKQGNGLGLSIAKEIVEAMGGKIWVESELGCGSTFMFTIPI